MISQRQAGITGGHGGPSSAWRGTLRRDLTVWLLVKIAALALLWGLFFSPAHRLAVTAATTGERLALKSPGASALPGAAHPGGKPR